VDIYWISDWSDSYNGRFNSALVPPTEKRVTIH
jgi:hypothetical protein